MIYDRIENIEKYNSKFSFVTEDLAKNDFIKGKFDTSVKDTFGIGLEYQTQPAENALWEAHRKYLDIHIILEGSEFVHISSIEKMNSSKAYEDDYELFEGKMEHSIFLTPGYFLVLFPHEVHKTSVMVSAIENVRKKVYKLGVNE